jgi:hypothetical protein
MTGTFVSLGGMARLEGSGVLFLRSLCRLTHVGHAQYYKGDGHAFQDYLEKHYPGDPCSFTISPTGYPRPYFYTNILNARIDKYVCGPCGAF